MASAGMAVSLVACAQNFGQFGSPFVINLLAAKLNANSVNAAAFLCAAAIAAILLLLALIWACRGLKKDLPSEN
jgi:sugar phosphate permease